MLLVNTIVSSSAWIRADPLKLVLILSHSRRGGEDLCNREWVLRSNEALARRLSPSCCQLQLHSPSYVLAFQGSGLHLGSYLTGSMQLPAASPFVSTERFEKEVANSAKMMDEGSLAPAHKLEREAYLGSEGRQSIDRMCWACS